MFSISNFSPAAIGFQIIVDGTRLQSGDFVLEREHDEPVAAMRGAGSANSALKYSREWRHRARNLLVEQHVIVHNPLPMAAQLAEAWVVVRNLGHEPVTLTRIDSAVLSLPSSTPSSTPSHANQLMYFTGSWGLEFESIRETLHGPKILETRAGRSSQTQHPWFALFGDGFTLSAAPAWSGNWIFRFEPTADDHGDWQWSGGLNDWEFSKTLQAGEDFAGIPVVIVAAPGNDLNAISVAYARVGRQYWYPRNALSASAPMEWNHWWSYEDKAINEDVFKANVDVAARLGFEVAMLDAGWFGPSDPAQHWYEFRADWALVNDTRFPSGLRALADYTHAHGLKFGIWCEIEGLGVKAQLASDHPDFVATREGERLGYVCFGNPAVQDWAFQTLSRLIEDWRADWIKLDFNLDPGAGCNRTDHGHAAGDGLYAHYEGYYAVLERVRQRFPQVVLENCSSGGLRIDLGMLRRADMTFLSDPDWPEHALQLFWGASTMLAPDAMLRWCNSEWLGEHRAQKFDPRDPNLKVHQLDYFFRIGMLSVWGLSVKLPDLPDWAAERLRLHIGFYKSIARRYVQQADVFRLTGQPRRFGAGERWAAFQFAMPDRHSHLLYVFRLHDAESTQTVKLQALEPEQQYQVSWLGRDLGVAKTERMAGETLLRDGLTFQDLLEEDAAILFINAA